MENWIPFYEAIANGLRAFKDRSPELHNDIRKILSPYKFTYLDDDESAGGPKGIVRDICPFTTMAPMEIAAVLQAGLPVCLEYLSRRQFPSIEFLCSITSIHGFSDTTMEANKVRLPPLGRENRL